MASDYNLLQNKLGIIFFYLLWILYDKIIITIFHSSL